MTPEQLTVLAILAVAFVLFASDRFRVDVVALIVLSVLLLSGTVTAEQAFQGFASPAVITVGAVFVVSAGLIETGVADRLAATMLRLTGPSPVRINAVVMITCGLLSAVMNNIGAAAILLPAVLAISRRTQVSPSKLLIPLAFASLMGGNITAIGTPPNILANSILEDYDGLEPFGLLEFAPMGILILLTGLAYFTLIGTFLLPSSAQALSERESYPLRQYLALLNVPPTSTLLGKRLRKIGFGSKLDINVISIRRLTNYTVFATSGTQIRGGDHILVEGHPIAVENLSEQYDLEIEAEHDDNLLEAEVLAGGMRIVEVALNPSSPLIGQTLREIRFRNRFGATVLSIRHKKWSTQEGMRDVPLQFGDSLLLTGPEERLDVILEAPDFISLDEATTDISRRGKSIFAIGILIGVLLATTTGLLPISSAMLIGAVLSILTGTVTMEEAYEAIDWRSIFLIAGMLPLGTAMLNTGTAEVLAQVIIGAVGQRGPVGVMMGLYVLAVLLTTVMSNAAVAVVIVPIAIDAALGLNVSPQTYVMAVVIATSTSFIMPIGHQVNILVYAPGQYRFWDYARVGVGLSLLIALLVGFVLPIIWPLSG